ncbi:MAG TPA: hypothetical protein P5571_05635 [Candidatus Krumholzibacteria bacterium]|nr:hypothetical protein [Candidatus Krumholzibacteria bacterium]HRX50820.1 hypothetical protein [Candidatus Krumholzibacteria bacterium]
MAKHIDVLLLTALPASGKSEVRRYLASLSPEECEAQFGIGHTVQLDDYPYVHMMRRVSQELRALGQDPAFFDSDSLPMKEPKDWGTLIELLNEDYDDLVRKNRPAPECAVTWLMERFDVCRAKVGATAFWNRLPMPVKQAMIEPLRAESEKLLQDKVAEVPDTLEGKTVVVEFARGGRQGSSLPLQDPFGYQYSFRMLSPAMLSKACVLYIWVSPEESRRKNEARTDPNDPGSILHHGVPIEVMLGDYGCDDMAHLLAISDVPDTVTVKAHGTTYRLPLGRFDNRVDRTTFIREPADQWSDADVTALQTGMREAFDQIFSQLDG